MQDFRRLKVWQRAHALSLEVHRAVATFPRIGFGELRLQLTSAADSIASNIAEGSPASTQREFARYLDMAIRTASETEHHLLCALDRRALARQKHDELSEEVVEIRRMLFSLRKRVLDAASAERKPRRVQRPRRSTARPHSDAPTPNALRPKSAQFQHPPPADSPLPDSPAPDSQPPDSQPPDSQLQDSQLHNP